MNLSSLIRSTSRLAPYETLEELFVSPDGFNVPTASLLQRAICRAVEGRPLLDLWDDLEVRAAFGNVNPDGREPEEVVVVTGIRSGKSKLAACSAVHMTQKCDMSSRSGVSLGPGEVPRVSVISVKTDLAKVVFNQHLLGSVMASPFLRELILDKPTKDTVLLRHPSGRPVEVSITAGSKAGASLVARWSAGVIFDEAARMQGQEDGVVNLDDQRGAVLHRLLRNAKLWYITSKWRPSGLIHEWETNDLGKPGSRLVVSAPAHVMNPVGWTPAVVKAAYENDEKSARVDLGNEYQDAESGLFPDALLRLMRRDLPQMLPYKQGCIYMAAMDPATKGNSWTLIIVAFDNGKIKVAYANQWTGSKHTPLNPRVVLREIKAVLVDYHLPYVLSDQWADDALRELALIEGLGVVVEDLRGVDRTNSYLAFLRRCEAGLVELSPDLRVTRDLSGVLRRPMPDGSVKIVLSRTGDGRHCDFAPPLVAAAARFMEELPKPGPPKPQDEQEELEGLEAQTPWSESNGDIQEWFEDCADDEYAGGY